MGCQPAAFMVFAGAVPVYVYECQQCSQQWEYLQSMKDPPKKKCEKCGGKLDKIIAPTAFVLKGGGWYKDLYSSAAPKSETKSETKSESKTETKSESKTATKTETKTSKPSGGSKE